MTRNLERAAEAPNQVGIWIRVSTEDQAKGESPEHHEKRAHLYAEAQNYEVREVYRLEAVSGKSVMEHPETKRMLADIKSGRISGLIFSKLARLARNTRELLDFADIFRAHDAALISLQESLDTGTAAGRFFYTIIGALAEWERSEIADRVAASVAIRAKLGKPLGGRPHFGYMWKDKKLIPNPDEAPVRRLVYELYREYRRKKTVARILNERGYRSRAGKKFQAKVIEDLIRDSTPKGVYRSNFSSRRTGRYALKDEKEWVMTQVEPIISEELWDECNHILMSQKEGERTPGPRPVYIFGGVVRCSCGTKMYARKRTQKYVCEKCNIKIPAADLEAIYHSQLESFLLSDEQVSAFFHGADDELTEKQALLARRGEERERVKKEIDQLFDLYFAGQVPKEGFGAKYEPLGERLKQIETDQADLQAQLDVGRMLKLNRDHMRDEALTLHGRWDRLSIEEKRNIVQTITDGIVVGKDEVAINLFYMPPQGSADRGTQRVGSPDG